MHILIIGAAGMVGRKLTDRLVASGIGGKAVDALTLVDVVPPAAPAGFKGKTETLTADLSEIGASEKLVAKRPDVIFHLAAIVSGEAEADFEKGYRINLDGTRNLSMGNATRGSSAGTQAAIINPAGLMYGQPNPTGDTGKPNGFSAPSDTGPE